MNKLSWEKVGTPIENTKFLIWQTRPESQQNSPIGRTFLVKYFFSFKMWRYIWAVRITNHLKKSFKHYWERPRLIEKINPLKTSVSKTRRKLTKKKNHCNLLYTWENTTHAKFEWDHFKKKKELRENTWKFKIPFQSFYKLQNSWKIKFISYPKIENPKEKICKKRHKVSIYKINILRNEGRYTSSYINLARNNNYLHVILWNFR